MMFVSALIHVLLYLQLKGTQGDMSLLTNVSIGLSFHIPAEEIWCVFDDN